MYRGQLYPYWHKQSISLSLSNPICSSYCLRIISRSSNNQAPFEALICIHLHIQISKRKTHYHVSGSLESMKDGKSFPRKSLSEDRMVVTNYISHQHITPSLNIFIDLPPWCSSKQLAFYTDRLHVLKLTLFIHRSTKGANIIHGVAMEPGLKCL